MAKTYIGMILAGSIAVTSFAAGHAAAVKTGAAVKWDVQAAATIDSTKTSTTNRDHSIAMNVGLKAGPVAGNLYVLDNGSSADMSIDDLSLATSMAKAKITFSYTGKRTEFGDSLNVARAPVQFANVVMVGTNFGGGASSSFDLAGEARDLISASFGFGAMDVAVEYGKFATNPLTAADTSDEIAGVSVASKLKGFKLGAGFREYSDDNRKVEETSVSMSTKLAGKVDLTGIYRKTDGKTGFTSELEFMGLRASAMLSGFGVSGQYAKGKNKTAGTDQEIENISVSKDLSNHVKGSLGYNVSTDTGGSETKTTQLLVQANF